MEPTIEPRTLIAKGLRYTVRVAEIQDADRLPALRGRIDGETEHMDREAGEAPIDVKGFQALIAEDAASAVRLFLVAEMAGNLVGYARCEGSSLRRFAHRAEFGVGILQDFWGYGIARTLLETALDWADAGGITKVYLSVLSTNESAIRLYENHGFELEGRLKNDRKHADGQYYDTLHMGRFRDQSTNMI